jgi:hypothetical protein
MKFAFLIQISIFRSPGFSRIRRSRHYAAAPTGIHRRKPGLLNILYPDNFFKIHAV